jgi:hypothetical protein
MNKAFKVVWNALRRQFVVVNEFQKSKKKAKSRTLLTSLLIAALIPASAFSATIVLNGAFTTIGNGSSMDGSSSYPLGTLSAKTWPLATLNATIIYNPTSPTDNKISILSNAYGIYSDNGTVYLGTDVSNPTPSNNDLEVKVTGNAADSSLEPTSLTNPLRT